MTKHLYVYKTTTTLIQLYGKKTGDIDFKVLQESLMNLPVLVLPNYQITFFLFVYKKEENDFGMLSPKHRDRYRQIGYYSQQLDPVVQ